MKKTVMKDSYTENTASILNPTEPLSIYEDLSVIMSLSHILSQKSYTQV